MSHSYLSIVGELSSKNWINQLVFVFGDAKVDSTIPEEKIYRIKNPSAKSLSKLYSEIELKMFHDGIIFVLPEKANSIDMNSVLEIQKNLLHTHFKFIFHPSHSHIAADHSGVRTESLPSIVRTINSLRNYPWLFASPMADKLMEARVGLPVTLLLPGPSLAEILPHLKEIKKHSLIVCIAKTLRACLKAGVVPDVVIQMDTYQMQQHYYNGLPPMPETLLVPLSIAPIHLYAQKFRGVVMMDSFNTELLPNHTRLRESCVSTLMACLGLAETLQSPVAFVVGANLSSPADPSQHPYHDQSETYPMISVPQESHSFLLSSREGPMVHSLTWYIAAAVEADLFAQAIADTSKTMFFSTTDATLLSDQWFPYKPVKDILGLPLIDRQQYLKTIDMVLSKREEINITKTRMYLLKQLSEARQIKKMYSLRGEKAANEVLQTHTMTKVAKRMRDASLNSEVDAIGVAALLSEKWCKALNDSRLLVQAITLANREKTLPLLCFAEEYSDLKKVLERIIPGIMLQQYNISNGVDQPSPDSTEINHKTVLPWLTTKQVVLVSPRIMHEFSYILDYAPDDNVYDLRLIVGENG